MATNAEQAYERWKAAIGQDEGAGDWVEIAQDRIDAFADVTDDHQFIHVDPEKAAQLSPWGTTIAHGFLTLSMLTRLTASLPTDGERLAGLAMGINYGFDKVRFVSPVKSGSRIRARSQLAEVELKDPNTIQTKRAITVEIEGEDRPALAAEWVTRLVYG